MNMRRLLVVIAILSCAPAVKATPARPGSKARHSYLFAWCGDMTPMENMKPTGTSDFLAVIDADPSSRRYGRVITTTPTGIPGIMPHHTGYEMSADGLLFANDFELGRTWIFDLHDPLSPKVVTSFGDVDGYSHPHSSLSLPDGNVLMTFQYRGDAMGPKAEGGGLVEIDNAGHPIRTGTALDLTQPNTFIRPYGVAAVPALDRAVSTNAAMHYWEGGHADTVQLWQLSTLRLLNTVVLPPSSEGAQYAPGEPRVLGDGRSVMIRTFTCGLYLLRGLQKANPTVRFVYRFPGGSCGVPVRLGHWWLQTVPQTHSLTVLDISIPEQPREVSRLELPDQQPHWIAGDPSGTRIVLDSGENVSDRRIFMIDFNPQTGAVILDKSFHDVGSEQPGVSTNGKVWPNEGFLRDAHCHGIVFSR
jgi:hypothetical protein